MQKIVLDVKYLLEKDTAHEYLQEKLYLPEYYGKNLDGLYDCLTDFVDTEIYVNTSYKDMLLSEEKTAYFHKIRRVFQAAARENENLKVVFL